MINYKRNKIDVGAGSTVSVDKLEYNTLNIQNLSTSENVTVCFDNDDYGVVLMPLSMLGFEYNEAPKNSIKLKNTSANNVEVLFAWS